MTTNLSSPPRVSEAKPERWFSVSGDIYDVWVCEQRGLPWLTGLIWGVIQPLGAYNHACFDVIYCYCICPHSMAWRRDWIVFALRTSVCLPGRINGLLTAVQLGVFYFQPPRISHLITLCQSDRMQSILWLPVQPLFCIRIKCYHRCKVLCLKFTPGILTDKLKVWATHCRSCHRCHVKCQLCCVIPQLSWRCLVFPALSLT